MVDWEYAFSGTPFFDLGNLTRPPLGETPGFTAAVERGYRGAGGELPTDWLRRSRLADLFSWTDFLNRPNPSETLIADARAMVERLVTDR